jgi:hypothetical protein
MKSVIFVLVMHALNGTDSRGVAVFESLEQCRAAQGRAAGNVAAVYSCDPVTVSGTWSRKASRYVATDTPTLSATLEKIK